MVKVKCENCGKEYEIEKKHYNRSKTKKFFCCKKCSCEYNNTLKNICFKNDNGSFIEIVSLSHSFRDIAKKLGYRSISSSIISTIKKRCEDLNIDYPLRKKASNDRMIKSLTKGELLKLKDTYQRYRSAIREDAEKTFKELDGKYKCCICGYDKHIEVAHVNPVSSFSNTTLIKDINSIKNILPLCPNHHWEFDNNKISEEDRNKIDNYIAERR